MVHLEFSLDAPVGVFRVVVSTIQMLYDSIMNIPHLMWEDRWTTAPSPSSWSSDIIVFQPVQHWLLLRRAVIGQFLKRCVWAILKVYVTVTDAAPNCPVAELAAPNRRRRVVLDRFVQSLNSHLVTRGYLSHRYRAKIQAINFIHKINRTYLQNKMT